MLIRKTAATKDRVVLPMPQTFQKTILPGSKQKAFRNSMEDWFGSSFVQEDELLFSNKESMLIATVITDFRHARRVPCRVGMPSVARCRRYDCPCLAGNSHAAWKRLQKQVVNLDHDEMKAMLRGQNIEPKNSTAENGDIILCLDGIPLCQGSA